MADDTACSTILALDEDGHLYRLTYRLQWDRGYHIREADFELHQANEVRRLNLRADGVGRWRDANGVHLSALDGCIDIDIWPTPLTNSLPIWRSQLHIGERREFRMTWVSAPTLRPEPKLQAYTRLSEHLYGFESLDEGGFRAELRVDDDGLVLDYPGLFRRVPRSV